MFLICKKEIVIEKAQNSDPEAIEILKNLDCFNSAKLDEATGGEPIYLTEENPTKTITFPDGSVIEYSSNNTARSDSTMTLRSSSRTESQTKNYKYLGVTVVGITVKSVLRSTFIEEET